MLPILVSGIAANALKLSYPSATLPVPPQVQGGFRMSTPEMPIEPREDPTPDGTPQSAAVEGDLAPVYCHCQSLNPDRDDPKWEYEHPKGWVCDQPDLPGHDIPGMTWKGIGCKPATPWRPKDHPDMVRQTIVAEVTEAHRPRLL